MHPFFCATFRKKSLTNISKIRFRAALSPAFDEFRLSFVHPRFPVPADFRLGFVQTSFDFLPKSERLPTKTHVRLVQIHYIWCFNHAPISNLLELIFFSSARFQVGLPPFFSSLRKSSERQRRHLDNFLFVFYKRYSLAKRNQFSALFDRRIQRLPRRR